MWNPEVSASEWQFHSTCLSCHTYTYCLSKVWSSTHAPLSLYYYESRAGFFPLSTYHWQQAVMRPLEIVIV